MITAAETSTGMGSPSFVVLVVAVIILILCMGAKK